MPGAFRLNNKRVITPDAALGKVIGGKTTMFKMNKCAVAVFDEPIRAGSIMPSRALWCRVSSVAPRVQSDD